MDITNILKQLDIYENALIKAFSDYPSKALRLTPGKRAARYQHIKQLYSTGKTTVHPSKGRDLNDSRLKKLGIDMPEHLRMTPEEAKTEKTQFMQRVGRLPKPPTT